MSSPICPFRTLGCCQLAQQLAGTTPVTICTDAACNVCVGEANPQAINSVTVSLAIATLHRARRTNEAAALSNRYRDLLDGRRRPHPSVSSRLPEKVWNLAKSLAAFASDGCKLVSKDEYAARLAVCDTCDRRRGGRCLECGCFLVLKARGRAFKCPLDKWTV